LFTKVPVKKEEGASKEEEFLKVPTARCGTVLAVALNLVRSLAALLEPYMPSVTEKILRQLNLPPVQIEDSFALTIPTGHKIGNPEVIFKKIEEKELKEFKHRYGAADLAPKEEEIFPADLRGGVVVEVNDHPNDENLYVTKVNIGTQTRQVVARLKSSYSKEELLGKEVVVLCNLPVADLKGANSEAMMLAAEGKKKKGEKEATSRLLHLQGQNKPASWAGTPITASGITKTNNNDLITLKEFQKLDLKLSKEGIAIFKQKFPLSTPEGANITAEGVEGPAKIK
jgi:tRNA-binding EMAP/Myf-like protein